MSGVPAEPPAPVTGAWDGHLLLLYDSEPERVAAVAAWVRRGLQQGEKVVYTEAPLPGRPSTLTQLEQHGVDSAQAVAEQRLALIPVEDFYPAQGQQRIVEAALREGFSSVRLSAESTTALSMLTPGEYLAIERIMDQLCQTHPVSALCQYARGAMAGPMLHDTVEVHVHGLRHSLLTSWATPEGTAIGGEVDISNTDIFASLVAAATDGGKDPAWLGLEQLQFLDAAGSEAILASTEVFRSRGGRVLLVSPQPLIARVLHLLGVDEAPGVIVVSGAR
jgi:anti-anti-sigma factor